MKRTPGLSDDPQNYPISMITDPNFSTRMTGLNKYYTDINSKCVFAENKNAIGWSFLNSTDKYFEMIISDTHDYEGNITGQNFLLATIFPHSSTNWKSCYMKGYTDTIIHYSTLYQGCRLMIREEGGSITMRIPIDYDEDSPNYNFHAFENEEKSRITIKSIPIKSRKSLKNK